MKKIAIITVGLSKVFAGEKCGGGEILLKNLIFSLLDFSDVSISILSPDNQSVTQNIKQKYPMFNFITYATSPYSLDVIQNLNKIISKENFDLVINYNMYIPFKTTILQCHSYIHKANNVHPLLRPIKKFLSRKKIETQKKLFNATKSNSDFIAVSQKIKDDYSKNFNIPPEKIKVIYPGVTSYPQKEHEKHKKLTFSIVANSSLNKGGHYLLFALGLLNLTRKNFNLQLIAPKFKKDPLMLFLVFLFNLKNKISVLPFQKDMTDFYSKTDVLVIPSLNEAFGLVCLEAMANKIPCLVSSFAGCSEIINKENGFVFNRSSFFDFLKQLNNILNIYNNNHSLFQKISISAYNSSKNFSWHSFAEKVIE